MSFDRFLNVIKWCLLSLQIEAFQESSLLYQLTTAVTKHFAACLKFKNLSLAQLPFVSRIVSFSVSAVWDSGRVGKQCIQDVQTTLDALFPT